MPVFGRCRSNCSLVQCLSIEKKAVHVEDNGGWGSGKMQGKVYLSFA
jgi:hypothetical protein